MTHNNNHKSKFIYYLSRLLFLRQHKITYINLACDEEIIISTHREVYILTQTLQSTLITKDCTQS